jgi:hypothetical protein
MDSISQAGGGRNSAGRRARRASAAAVKAGLALTALGVIFGCALSDLSGIGRQPTAAPPQAPAQPPIEQPTLDVEVTLDALTSATVANELQATITPLPTFTPLPTYTLVPTFTIEPTITPPAAVYASPTSITKSGEYTLRVRNLGKRTYWIGTRLPYLGNFIKPRYYIEFYYPQATSVRVWWCRYTAWNGEHSGCNHMDVSLDKTFKEVSVR